ncbi:hypothetical protein B0F90DRAFT_1823974 [Multifurca ochricompacta]|uniref:Endonuclease/exonuclease/phosphatase domain-containing protein n=1 Tax=Multifurca ochricompacta TaxID=376703 RepID=A0AAD4QJ75_9AGAM|nr:hypothetical protein B0F90DRAFT_1823974 [Multifurca ochricompacta]
MKCVQVLYLHRAFRTSGPGDPGQGDMHLDTTRSLGTAPSPSLDPFALNDHILLVHEPWFGQIGVSQSNTLPDGSDTFGAPAHPGWTFFYPSLLAQTHAKTLIYVRRFLPSHPDTLFPAQFETRHDICAHLCILVGDLQISAQTLRIVSFYNDVCNPSALHMLLALTLDDMPTVLVLRPTQSGDFNLHHPDWALPGSSTPTSSQASAFLDWASDQGLDLVSTPGLVTCHATNHAGNVLDLIWASQTLRLGGSLSPVLIDWLAGLGSDHAGLQFSWQHSLLSLAPAPAIKSYVTKASDDTITTWRDHLELSLPAVPVLDSADTVDLFATQLQDVILTISNIHLAVTSSPRAKRARWWNPACSQAVTALHCSRRDPATKAAAASSLCREIRAAKFAWTNDTIATQDVWDEVFVAQFFGSESTPVLTTFNDNPPQFPTRDWVPFTSDEIAALLCRTSSKSAPGFSKLNWHLLKWAWPVIHDHVTALFNGSVALGHVPPTWKHALTVVLTQDVSGDASGI